MKRILITLMMIAAFCSLSLAQKKSTIYKDSAENVKITISKTETEDDSVYTPEYTDTTEDGITVESESTDSYNDSYDDSSIISKEDFSLLKDPVVQPAQASRLHSSSCCSHSASRSS